MMKIRRSHERGHANHGWLDTFHTFSFADYYDPEFMGFRAVRVLNDDTVAPGRGFGTHGHRDMEIVSYVAEGALEHRDSLGTGSVIRPGDVQRMSAGTGVTHSEFNPSDSVGTRFLQIWVLPEKRGLPPSYEQQHFAESERRGRLRLVASRDRRDGAVRVHQDLQMYAGLLGPGDTVTHELAAGRGAWVQIVRGRVRLGSIELAEGDGAAVEEQQRLELTGVEDAEVLMFDVA